MQLAELFVTLAERGLSIRRKGGGMECVGPQDGLTPELKRHLTSHRETLLAVLPAAMPPAAVTVPVPEKYIADQDEKTSLRWWQCCLPEAEQAVFLKQTRKEWYQLTAMDMQSETKPIEPLPEADRPRMVRLDAPKYPPWIQHKN